MEVLLSTTPGKWKGGILHTEDRIGFIGLGSIGTPIAERIVRAGFELLVWNRSPEKMQALLKAGAEPAGSALQVGEQADIVLTCISTPAGLEEVLLGSQGLAGGRKRVSLVVDVSTMPPDFERKIGQQLKREAGIELIDVPVSGGVAGARAGTLTAMAGGRADLLERARPVILSFARHITHTGPLGTGQTVKACNQVISLGTMAAIAEGMALGERQGISMGQLASAMVGGFGDSVLMRELQRSCEARDSSAIRAIVESLIRTCLGTGNPDSQLGFSLVLKDLGIARELGRNDGLSLPLTAHMEEVFRGLHSTGHACTAD